MPHIYLSPSTQEYNPYVIGGNEEYYMNLIADAMQPYLLSSGITYTRNTPDMNASESIAQSNAGNYDLHLSLHSNAAPSSRPGSVRGTDIYYFPGSYNGQRLAEIMVENFKVIYPIPSLVRALPTTSLGEVAQTRAPAVLIEIAYHDNVQDANWIRNNINAIARTLVLSLTEYFGIPFVVPQPIESGVVATQGGSLNIRNKPNSKADIIGSIPNGADVSVLGSWYNWYIVDYNGTVGYAHSDYINIL